MTQKDILLGCMLVAYLIPILYVYYQFIDNPSICNIICREDAKYMITAAMVIMGAFTIQYERERKDTTSMIIIMCLLFGIYGLLFSYDLFWTHFGFAAIAFLSILGFMVHHTRKHNSNGLRLILLIAVYFAITTVAFFNQSIFLTEALFIGTFAVYYLSLHFMES
jgi:dolichol kinase